MPRYWVIAPVESTPAERFDKVWQFDLENNLISVGWGALGDVTKMSREALSKAVALAYPDKPLATQSLIVNMLWNFWHEIAPGDFVIARRGRSVLAGVGKVDRAAFYEPGRSPLLASPGYAHHGFVGVEWQERPRNRSFSGSVFPMITLKEMTEAEYRGFAEADVIPLLPQLPTGPSEEVEGPGTFTLEKHLEDFIVSNFHSIFKGELQMYEDGTGADGRQYSTDIGPIDILAYEPKSKTFAVIELKKGNSSDQVIGQILRYMGWVKKNLCKEGEGVRGLIICNDSDRKMSYALEMTNNITVRYYRVSFKLTETHEAGIP
jgi:restriction system protein